MNIPMTANVLFDLFVDSFNMEEYTETIKLDKRLQGVLNNNVFLDVSEE